jgi:lipopolysaccharide/colanic/teichoic acid biosynthesis glycosyltransferase
MRIIKRLLDILIALPVLILLLPVMLVVAIIILFDSGSPVLFRQQRPGYKEKPFILNKFRTMTNTYDPEGKLLSDGQRLTSVGKVLRKLSIDELPQLFNVLIGHMSLVGPRPLLMEYLPLYNAEQKRRHDAKPGITGWAQVNGRNAVDWDTRFKLDVWYVDNWSLPLDLKILLMTFIKVLKREGISAQGNATVEYFKGNKKDDIS